MEQLGFFRLFQTSKTLALGLISSLIFMSSPAYAASGKIHKIDLKGHRKIEAEAIRNKLVSKVGERFSREKVREDIKSIFAMGYFYDVIVDSQKVGPNKIKLIYSLVEKPTITSIEYTGNDEIDNEELEEAAEIKEYSILDNTKVQEAVESLEKLYEDKGFFLARVRPRVIEEKKSGTVKLVFEIQENDKVKVKQIKIMGNKQLSDAQLKAYMQTKEGGFFSFISGSGAYKQDAFDRDTQLLNYLYYNEGFVQVKIDRPQVYVTPDKKGIYITFNITEGDRYYIGSIDFTGDLIFDDSELREAISTKPGDQFSTESLQRDIRALTAKYGDLGYAYANPIPRTPFNEKEKLVNITFDIDKGNKVYLGKLNVKGNTKTRDKVLRRELRLREGELYNETRKRESLANIQRLGFFEEVNFHTKTPEGQPDRMDIDIVVKERNTGSIQVGAGYSSLDNLVINGTVNQTNFLGRGQKLGASIDWARSRKNITLNFTEPYFMDTEWEVGFDAYKRDRTLTEYVEDKAGGALYVGHPLAPYLRAIVGYKLDDTNLTLRNNSDPDLFPVETANGITSAASLSILYDRRNDRFAPSDGVYGRLAIEYAGLGGDLDYTKGGATFRYYKKIFSEVVWRNNLNYGFVSPNSNKGVPFNELYLIGGPNTLRGYDWFTIGKRKFSQIARDNALASGLTGSALEAAQNLPFGGRQQLYYNLEFQFPLIKEAGILGVVFYDIGYADDNLKLDDFRSDAGFGFRWFSPIGPLRFEWGFPTNPKEEFGEQSGANFQFSIGSPF